LPSLFESFSYACTEAMYLGKPVVGSFIGGMSDLIIHGKSGWLSDPFDFRSIKEGVEKLLHNVTLQRTMGEQAKTSIRYEYDNRKIINQQLGYYRCLIDNIQND
jgi:glycosyltransferase involved in cell wall biosynthesis